MIARCVSSRLSLTAWAAIRRARARPAIPMRSSVATGGRTFREALMSCVSRTMILHPSSASNAPRAANPIAVSVWRFGTKVRKSGCRIASRRKEDREASLRP